jgi:hypothetical protein
LCRLGSGSIGFACAHGETGCMHEAVRVPGGTITTASTAAAAAAVAAAAEVAAAAAGARLRLTHHAHGLRGALPVRPEAAERADALRHEPHVAHARHAGRHDRARGRHARAAAACAATAPATFSPLFPFFPFLLSLFFAFSWHLQPPCRLTSTPTLLGAVLSKSWHSCVTQAAHSEPLASTPSVGSGHRRSSALSGGECRGLCSGDER